MGNPYRGYREAPVKKLPIRIPSHGWRFESPLGENLLKKRVGQYAGPIYRHESLAIGGIRFEFRPVSKERFFLVISDDLSGNVLQMRMLGPGNSEIQGPDKTEIKILTYVIADDLIRASIIIEKKNN